MTDRTLTIRALRTASKHVANLRTALHGADDDRAFRMQRDLEELRRVVAQLGKAQPAQMQLRGAA